MNTNEMINDILEEANKNNESFSFQIEEESFNEFEQVARLGSLNLEIANSITNPEKFIILMVVCHFKESRNKFVIGHIFIEEDNKTYTFHYGKRLKENITTKNIKELNNKMNERAVLIDEHFKSIKEESKNANETLGRISTGLTNKQQDVDVEENTNTIDLQIDPFSKEEMDYLNKNYKGCYELRIVPVFMYDKFDNYSMCADVYDNNGELIEIFTKDFLEESEDKGMDMSMDEYLGQLTPEETNEEQFALEETNEEIRKCEEIILKLMHVKREYGKYINAMSRKDSERYFEILEEIEKIDDKIFYFIKKKNSLKSVNDK